MNHKKILTILTVFILVINIAIPPNASGITIKEEEELSREYMKVVFNHFKPVKDPLIVEYINTVGQKIVSVLPDQPFKYHFYIIKDDTYNAFATPAGHIFVNSGLFEAMDSEAELAGILAHEAAHVSCRHISQKIERSSKIGLATLAGIAAGIFLGIGGAAGAVSEAFTVGSMAAGQSASLAYSREDEKQADQLGLKYLNQAGYSADGLLTILKKIRNKEWFGSDIIPKYLMTHPAVEERIVYIETWMASEKSKFPEPKTENSKADFRKVHTRLLALYGDEEIALKKLNAQVQEYPEDPVAHHGYGLILERTGRRKDAIVHLKKALEKQIFNSYLLKDIGRTYFLNGQYPEALKSLESAISIDPSDPDTLFFMGRTQLEMKKFEAAASAFETLTEKHPDYKESLYFLGEAYGKQGNLEDAHYYLGLWYKDTGDFRNADFHLRKAKTLTKDPNRQAKIDEMLKEVRVIMKKIEKERK
jgi:predicted Zn-dependent protease